jgi:hypothetical protein
VIFDQKHMLAQCTPQAVADDLAILTQSAEEHVHQIIHTSYSKYTLSPLPITTFVFLVMIVATDYQNSITKNRVEG